MELYPSAEVFLLGINRLSTEHVAEYLYLSHGIAHQGRGSICIHEREPNFWAWSIHWWPRSVVMQEWSKIVDVQLLTWQQSHLLFMRTGSFKCRFSNEAILVNERNYITEETVLDILTQMWRPGFNSLSLPTDELGRKRPELKMLFSIEPECISATVDASNYPLRHSTNYTIATTLFV